MVQMLLDREYILKQIVGSTKEVAAVMTAAVRMSRNTIKKAMHSQMSNKIRFYSRHQY